MDSLPPSSALILVAVMPSQRDMEIARMLGWYRIPFRHAPKVVDVDYLAFYQTGVFGEAHRWRIETFAEVQGHELTTRFELFHDESDHPRAHEEYYKIQLSSLKTLPEPILADHWRRLTFLYTTGELFRSARKLRDLVVRSEERQILWGALRERLLQDGQYKARELPEVDLDPLLLAMLGDLNLIDEGEDFYLSKGW